MRDKADLQLILTQPALGELIQQLPLDKTLFAEFRSALKVAKRQFARLVEMAVLLKLGLEDAPKDKQFRLMVKERLYRHNAVSPFLPKLYDDCFSTNWTTAFEGRIETH